MKQNRVSSGTRTIDVPEYLLDGHDDSDKEMSVEFYFSPEEKAQMYESRGRLPCPGSPAEIEVSKITKTDGTLVEWDDLSQDEQCGIEEKCWEHIGDLSEDPRY